MGAVLEGKRVLVVEDEFFLADDLREALEKAGAEVLGPAPTVEAAMGLLQAERVDMAVVDINLKGRADFTIPDRLAAQGVPFVFATGYDAGIIPDRHAGVPRWEKPYRIGEVVKALERGVR